MVKKCTLEIRDEVNIKFSGLDVITRRKLADEVKFFLPYARHVPAYKLGRWDGMMRFCDIGGRSYFHILDRLLPIVVGAGYELDIQDDRIPHEFEFDHINEQSYSHITWPEGHPVEGQPIVLRDYQVDVINKYLENPQSLQEISTGAGKTLITAVLSHQVEKYGRSIVIVPSKDLVTQTEEDYINMGLDVGVFFGDRKEYGKTHTICTWQSLESLDKKSKKYDSEVSVESFIEDVVCVMVDEAHSSKADVLKKLLTTHFRNCPIRWGMTGTIPKEEHFAMGLQVCLGPVVNRVKAKDLQEKGVLSNLHVHVQQLVDPPLGFKDYASELKWLTSDRNRVQKIAEMIEEVEGNSLILVTRIDTGNLLQEMIPDSVFIKGDVKSKDRKAEYKDVNTADNKVVIATFGVAAVGINIPRIFNLFMIEPGKSFVRVIQSIGRGIRTAKDKDYVDIYDITSTCKYSKRHLTERKRYYKEAEYPFKVTKIKY
jgi:superfamily II DNA or RNA helicase